MQNTFTASFLQPKGDKFLVDDENSKIFQQLLEIEHQQIDIKHFTAWKKFIIEIGNRIPTKEEYNNWLCGLQN